MKILEIEQGTPAWHEARRASVTGTKLQFVMSGGTARHGLIADLIAEEATEQTKEMRISSEMERGTAEEVFAVKEFEQRTGKKVDRVGICVSDEYSWLKLSPDGLIKDKSGKYTEAVEIKCPDSKKAILYRIENMIPLAELGLLTQKGQPYATAPFIGIPADYKWQVVNYFIVNRDLQKLYFLVYDARIIDNNAKLYTVTVERSNPLLQEAMKQAEQELERFRSDWIKWKEIVLPIEF